MSITKTLDFVNQGAEKIDSADPVTIKEHNIDVGQFYAQGDVALVRLAGIPEGSVRVSNPTAKIVPGTSQGAQHVWDSMEGVEAYQPPTEMQGPTKGLIYSLSKERTLTHPEHANHTYFEGFIGFTCFQQGLSGLRVQD